MYLICIWLLLLFDYLTIWFWKFDFNVLIMIAVDCVGPRCSSHRNLEGWNRMSADQRLAVPVAVALLLHRQSKSIIFLIAFNSNLFLKSNFFHSFPSLFELNWKSLNFDQFWTENPSFYMNFDKFWPFSALNWRILNWKPQVLTLKTRIFLSFDYKIRILTNIDTFLTEKHKIWHILTLKATFWHF